MKKHCWEKQKEKRLVFASVISAVVICDWPE
jgi:hypothetical protein